MIGRTAGLVATKHWKVEISRLGSSDPLFLGTVEAATWPAALMAGRKEIGESGGVPAGASCNVNPNGTVTIQDARERRRYQIVPTKAPAPPPGTKRPIPSTPELVRPAPARPAVPVPTSSPVATSAPRPSAVPMPASPKARAPAAAPLAPSAPRPSSPPPSTVENKLILLTSRDEQPSASSPIHFRERMYAVPVPFEAGTGEKLALKLLRQVQNELEKEAPGAKYVRIELFDHIWKEAPSHAAVVRLEWKDWSTSIEIDFPLEEQTRQSEIPRISSVPPPPTEDRLAVAFEACHDLLFLKNRAEALEFAVHLLEELVPCEATGAFLLDVNTDEFRLVAARGTGARQRRGKAFPSSAGLLGAASSLAEHAVLVLADAPADPRYDENVDGVPGMDTRSLLYRPLIHRGRLFGLLQLANGVGGRMFTESDCEVVDYVTQQLSIFVAKGASLRRLAASDG